MARESVVIIDYGSGNLRSAAKAFERVRDDEGLELEVKVSAKPEDLKKATRIVLPGQGAFGDCLQGLTGIKGMREALQENVIKKAKPFLGICVGMQLMATRGMEHGIHAGLDWIPGEAVPMKPANDSLKIPHMGWNELVIPSPSSAQDNRHFVLRSANNGTHYYFVHSFMFKCEYDHHILGMTDYGGLVNAVVGKDNMVGVQFHPEKSQQDGLRLISDFLQWKP
ncbi:MAG: imidazole glycerol phosphate synthase subunit HisH [Alphaproteobacteria bacterium PRO2]|nr:imidazole glycerol phosphate synthase subunit HisH [Alphaproteobacteria bacterium PRO2]